MSLRNYFFTPRVARAATAPSTIVLVSGATALGIALGGLPGALVAGISALVTRLGIATASSRAALNPSGPKIEPGALHDPWRRYMTDVRNSQRAFAKTVSDTPSGPLRDRLASLQTQVEHAAHEAWGAASSGNRTEEAIKRLNLEQLQHDRDQTDAEIRSRQAGGFDSDALIQTLNAIDAQIAASHRMSQTVAAAKDKLRLMEARLDEVVARATEISVSGSDPRAAAGLESDVESIVSDMEALRAAVVETQAISRTATFEPTDGLTTTSENPGPSSNEQGQASAQSK